MANVANFLKISLSSWSESPKNEIGISTLLSDLTFKRPADSENVLVLVINSLALRIKSCTKVSSTAGYVESKNLTLMVSFSQSMASLI